MVSRMVSWQLVQAWEERGVKLLAAVLGHRCLDSDQGETEPRGPLWAVRIAGELLGDSGHDPGGCAVRHDSERSRGDTGRVDAHSPPLSLSFVPTVAAVRGCRSMYLVQRST